MKSYFKSAIAAALVLALGGCSTSGSRPTEGSVSSIIIVPIDSATGSGVTISNPNSGAADGGGSSAASRDEMISTDRTVPVGEKLTVYSGETLYIKDGATLTVDGEINCANGAQIKLQSGGSLLLNGKMTLDGGLDLGGFLGIKEKGEIAGNGVLNVLNSFNDINCEGTCRARINAPAPVEKDGVTYVGGVLIVNKKYSVPEDYGAELGLVIDEAYDTLLQMREDTGYSLPLVSGYRSYELQTELFNYYCEIDDLDRVEMYSARPGHSEHQTGLAMDIGELSESYADTVEGGWLTENCFKYGFIIRFPKGSEQKTGYDYEPWHIRWLGKSTAKLVYDSGLTLEEFLGVEPM